MSSKTTCLLILFIVILTAAFVSNAQSADSTKRLQGTNRRLKIKSNPRVSAEGCVQGQAFVRLRVTFGADKTVKEVETVIQSSCQLFTERAIKSAYMIKFTPEIREGVAVEIKKLIEYRYSRY
jgi:hypothetical protein